MSFVSVDAFGRRQRLVSEDGTIEELRGATFRLLAPSGGILIERPAEPADAARFAEAATEFEDSLGSILNNVPQVRATDRAITAIFPTGESLQLFAATGRFVRRDAEGEAILVRPATAADEFAFDAFAELFDGEIPSGGVRFDTARNRGAIGGPLDNFLFGRKDRDGVDGRGGDDLVSGGDGDDRLFGGAGRDVLFGETGADALDGGGGSDRLFGGSGGDTLVGDGGGDLFFGGAGADALDGGDGDDLLDGGAGADLLRGGFGADRFVFEPGEAGGDRIEDFQFGQDRIDLSAFGFSGFGDLVLRQNFSETVIDLGGGGSIRIDFADVAEFEAGDFLFA